MQNRYAVPTANQNPNNDILFTRQQQQQQQTYMAV